MIKVLFIILMIVLSYTDIRRRFIPNIVVIPAIVIGCYLTGNWLWAGLMLTVGVTLFKKGKFCGGDGKLLAMMGAFIGIWAIPTALIGMGLLRAYRDIVLEFGALPVAPFLFAGSMFFIGII